MLAHSCGKFELIKSGKFDQSAPIFAALEA
jgi:hypothetical protein